MARLLKIVGGAFAGVLYVWVAAVRYVPLARRHRRLRAAVRRRRWVSRTQ